MMSDVIYGLGISLCVVFIQYTMRDGEVFGFLGRIFSKHLPELIHNPVFACPVCMTPWYGTGLMFLYGNFNWFALACACGWSVCYVTFQPKEDEGE
jgi:hypothetical protein